MAFSSKPFHGPILISWNLILYTFLCTKIKKITIVNIFFLDACSGPMWSCFAIRSSRFERWIKCNQVTNWFSKFNLFDQTEILMRSCSAIWSGRNWGSIPWVQVLTKCTQVTFCSSRNWEKMAERSVRVGFQKIGFPFIDRNNSALQYHLLLPVENCYRYISVLPVHWWFSRYL